MCSGICTWMTSAPQSASTVTPFRDDGALDLESTDRLTDFYLDCGVTGFTVLGVMGEAPKLTADESRAYVKRVLARVNGRVPVIVGVSSPGFAAMGEIARSVMDLGASGVMVGPGAAVQTNDQAVAWYEMAAETLGPATPFCVQDHPLAYNGVQLPLPVLTRIFKAIPTAVMLKHEDWPGPGLAKLAGDPRGERPRRHPAHLHPRRQRRRSLSCRRNSRAAPTAP